MKGKYMIIVILYISQGKFSKGDVSVCFIVKTAGAQVVFPVMIVRVYGLRLCYKSRL